MERKENKKREKEKQTGSYERQEIQVSSNLFRFIAFIIAFNRMILDFYTFMYVQRLYLIPT